PRSSWRGTRPPGVARTDRRLRTRLRTSWGVLPYGLRSPSARCAKLAVIVFARLCFSGARASLGSASLRGRFAALRAARSMRSERTGYTHRVGRESEAIPPSRNRDGFTDGGIRLRLRLRLLPPYGRSDSR